MPALTVDTMPQLGNRNGQEQPIGMIGLGLLGTALCERLLGAGYPVYVFNRTREKAEPLIAMGAQWSDNPLKICDRVVISLYTTVIVEEILDLLADGLRPGQILIDTTTGDPDQTSALGERLASRDVQYLETPIAASSEQTRQGEAVAFVAGVEETYAKCEDLFDCFTKKSIFVGGWGDAARVKLVNNLVLGLNRLALAEGLVFSEAIGVPRSKALEVLKESNAYSGVMDVKGQKMVDEDFSTQGRLSQHIKDVRLMFKEATQAGISLPVSNLHLQLLNQAETLGLGDSDNSAIISSLKQKSQAMLG